MGVSEILEEIKLLPTPQRWEILERTREMLDGDIPESFKQAPAQNLFLGASAG